jgi:biopolymer transport protein ExbD
VAAKRKRKRHSVGYQEVELNIMPFIDVFSMLNTFLLFSAVFFSLGMFEVQLPFFSNSPESKEKPTRSLEVKVEVSRDKVELVTSYTLPPVNERTDSFSLNEDGLSQLHAKLVEIRRQNEETKRLTLFSDDDVIYNDLAKVLDAVKSRYETDPVLYYVDDATGNRMETRDTLFPQVVMGSVIL